MYRASDRVEHEDWIEELEAAADDLDLSPAAVSTATDLFLADVPESERSKRAVVAASLYAGALVEGESRSQSAVAEAADVSRLAVQKRWKPLLERAGFETPDW